ncbi:MAG: ATP-binding protein [Planctomycetota bacterium]
MTPTEAMSLTPEAQLALAEIRRRGDRLMSRLLIVHGVLALCMASAYSTWWVTLVVAPAALAMFFGVKWLAPQTFLSRATAGVALQTFCALHIYQYHGLAEQHFWFFTATTAMIAYKDPRALWPGVALIIGQHVLFATLQNSGVQLYFFDVGYVGVTKLAYHFGIALVQTALAATIATSLRNRTIAEADLRADLDASRKRVESAAVARSSFLSSMSHEFRTPMNGIEGMADALLEGDLDDDQRECAETIRSSSRALLAIVGDILDFSKIESGKLQLVSRPFALGHMAQGVERILRPRATANRVALRTELAPGLPEYLDGDEGRLRQVILNLAGNALKFAEDGNVTIHVGGDMLPDGRFALELKVADDGIGISAAAQARIFEPFEQADAETAVRYGGTGLGLAITRRLVQLMSGELSLKSAPHSGSTFTVRVPLHVCHEPQRIARSKRAGASGDTARFDGLRVLVVEDNAVNQRVALRLLGLLGCQVTVAKDGVEGLACMAAQEFDLTLMDCQMPRMDGYETTRRRREIERERGLLPMPILALTASALEEDHERCRREGMDECVTKPVNIEALSEALGRHARTSPSH